MKKQFLLTLGMLVPLILLSQQLRTYSGSFNNGKATYNYYEKNDLTRIFHGPFTYTGPGNNPSRYNATVNGQYHHGEKQGIWKTTLIKKLANSADKSVSTLEYMYGSLNNMVTINRTVTLNNKVTSSNIYKINFSSGSIYGKFNMGNLSGEFNMFQIYEGRWHYKNPYGDLEYLADFNKGILINLISRRISDGKITFRYAMNETDLNKVKSKSYKDLHEDSTLNLNNSEFKVVDTARPLFHFYKIILKEFQLLFEIETMYPKGSQRIRIFPYSISTNDFKPNY